MTRDVRVVVRSANGLGEEAAGMMNSKKKESEKVGAMSNEKF